MAKKSAVSQYLAQIGREGGKAKVKKGFGKLSKARRREIAKQGGAARWGKKAEDCASHGGQVEQIRAEILAALAGVVPGPARIPMVSAGTGQGLRRPEGGLWA